MALRLNGSLLQRKRHPTSPVAMKQDPVQGYPEIGLEILGNPKTVRLQGTFRGQVHSAPLEVWVMALVSVLTTVQKARFFDMLSQVQSDGDYQRIQRAQIVADIPMPPLA